MAGTTNFIPGSGSGNMQQSQYDPDADNRVEESDTARALDADGDGVNEQEISGTTWAFDPNDDGTIDYAMSASEALGSRHALMLGPGFAQTPGSNPTLQGCVSYSNTPDRLYYDPDCNPNNDTDAGTETEPFLDQFGIEIDVTEHASLAEGNVIVGNASAAASTFALLAPLNGVANATVQTADAGDGFRRLRLLDNTVTGESAGDDVPAGEVGLRFLNGDLYRRVGQAGADPAERVDREVVLNDYTSSALSPNANNCFKLGNLEAAAGAVGTCPSSQMQYLATRPTTFTGFSASPPPGLGSAAQVFDGTEGCKLAFYKGEPGAGGTLLESEVVGVTAGELNAEDDTLFVSFSSEHSFAAGEGLWLRFESPGNGDDCDNSTSAISFGLYLNLYGRFES